MVGLVTLQLVPVSVPISTLWLERRRELYLQTASEQELAQDFELDLELEQEQESEHDL